VVFVVHDWGSALGFDWAKRHPDAVRGLVYMESFVAPMRFDEFQNFQARKIFVAMRSSDREAMVLDDNVFVGKILPRSIQRELAVDEMNEYRRPFLHPGEDRRPTLTWPRQISLDGQPADVTQNRRGLLGLAGQQRHPQTLHQRGARRHPHRPGAGTMPHVAKSTGSDGQRHPLHPARLTRTDSRRAATVVERIAAGWVLITARRSSMVVH
jgi:pimeloyl-ACP methyl ester carboxylesterase